MNIWLLASWVAGVGTQFSGEGLPVACQRPLMSAHSMEAICSRAIWATARSTTCGYLAIMPVVPAERPEPVTGSRTAPAA